MNHQKGAAPASHGAAHDRTSVLVSIAAFGLAGSRLDLPGAPLGSHAWTDLVHRCRTERLVPFLAAAVAADALPATRGQVEALAVLEVEATGLALLLEQRVAALSGLLRTAQIGHRVIDGPARAHVAYPTPELRSFDTVSVVVPPARLHDARTLAAQRAAPTPGPRAVRTPRLVMRTAFWASAGSTPIGVVDLAGAPQVIDLAGRQVAVLNTDEQLVCACADLATAGGADGLVRRRDIAALVLAASLDPGRARRLAAEWHATEQVAWAIADVWRTFDLADKTELSVWAQRLRVPAPPATGSIASAHEERTSERARGRMPRMLRRRHHPVAESTATRRPL